MLARDGDYGINNDISYRLNYTGNVPHFLPLNTYKNQFSDLNITINENTGLISIHSIDRDVGIDQVVLAVTAYETVDPDWTNTQIMSLIVDDIDDNLPLITIKDSINTSIILDIDENYNAPLDPVIVITDIDLVNKKENIWKH